MLSGVIHGLSGFPGFLLGTDFLISSKQRKLKRYCPIGTEKIREVAHKLLITVVQYSLPHSQPVKSYTVTAHFVRNDPALPHKIFELSNIFILYFVDSKLIIFFFSCVTWCSQLRIKNNSASTCD